MVNIMEEMDSFEKVSKKIKDIISVLEKKPTNINYWGCYKRIKKIDLSKIDIPRELQIKIALLSSFTIEPLGVYFDIECRKLDLFPDIYISGFNQFRQDVFNLNGPLYKFKPDITVLAVNLDDYLDSLRESFFDLTMREKQDLIQKVIEEIKGLTNTFKENASGLLLINDFIVPIYSPLGIIDNKEEMGIREFYQTINQKLINEYKNDERIYVFDLNKMASSFGIQNVINYKMHYMASMEISEAFLPFLINEYMTYVKALRGMVKKCIVLDLDDTLWGGIIGEDGLEGIKLDEVFPGNQYRDFQKALLQLNKRGIILAINSKNNYDDAIEVLRKHPSMILREENFASIKINWENKVKNFIEISEEIGIGLNSMVFFDDNPVERELVKKSLPEVLVVDLPKSPSLYRQALENLKVFDTLSLTEEDKKRSMMYKARSKRKKLEKSIKNIDEYLKSLDIVISIKEMDEFSFPRISNLILKTNQFNLTTRRYSKTEIQEMGKNPNYKIYYLKVKDRFGDEGIVGVAILKISEKEWTIDSFLMSCRVIGRKIEIAFLWKIIQDAMLAETEYLKGIFVRTKKNDLVSNFYKDFGFRLITENENESEWILDLKNVKIKPPEFIKIED
ncbi:MAG: HAD-IIIC family phosphatase [Candidatus Helarchaeota archaeon]